MKKGQNLIKRLVLFFIGMIIIQFGVSLFLKLNIGSDPFTVFNQGIAFLLNITPGQANIILLILLTFTILVVKKSYINIGTIICVFGVGPIIDLALYCVSYIKIDSYNIFTKSLLLILVSFIIAVGFSILAETNLGVAPNDSIYFIVKDKINIEYRWARIGIDICYLIIGYLCGGVVGIGTIISALLTGPFVQICLPYGKKLVNLIIGKNRIENVDLDLSI